jgi:hypothetical protein
MTRDLQDAAHELALEIRDGKWDHVRCLDQKPASACPEIIEELRKRCPGYPEDLYKRAIADGLFGSR